jgi:uncharacterized protein YeaO (DUF488 family)
MMFCIRTPLDPCGVTPLSDSGQRHFLRWMRKMEIRIKRIYEEPDGQDGTRILVDRLWPRGLTKEKAKVDLWLKDVAPSTELRRWFAHDAAKWTEFQTRYREELHKNEEPLSLLKQAAAKGTVTLLYGARDQQHNEAVVLQRLLKSR